MSTIDKQIAAMAVIQHGIITRQQLVALGISHHAIRNRIEGGRLQIIRKCTYLVAGSVPSRLQTIFGAVMSATPAVASHSTAAYLWGIQGYDHADIELSTPRDHQVRQPKLIAHRSVHLLIEEQTIRHRIPVTTYERLVIDMSGRLEIRELGKLLDYGLREDKCNLESLRRISAGLPSAPGRKMSKVRSLLKKRLPGYDPGENDFEMRVLRAIVDHGLPEPQAQREYVIDETSVRPDYVYSEYQIAIEADSFKFHTQRSDFDRNANKCTLLAAHGWIVLHFTTKDSNEYIARTVHSALISRGALPALE